MNIFNTKAFLNILNIFPMLTYCKLCNSKNVIVSRVCVCTGKTGETFYLGSANRKIKTEIFSSVNARHRPNNEAQKEGDSGAGAGNS